MSVRWPDGSLTGSVHVDDTAPAPVEPEPEIEPEPETVPEGKKEVAHGDR